MSKQLTVNISDDLYGRIADTAKQYNETISDTLRVVLLLAWPELTVSVTVTQTQENKVYPPPAGPPPVTRDWSRPGTHLDKDKITPIDCCPTCGEKLEQVDDDECGTIMCCQAHDYYLPKRSA